VRRQASSTLCDRPCCVVDSRSLVHHQLIQDQTLHHLAELIEVHWLLDVAIGSKGRNCESSPVLIEIQWQEAECSAICRWLLSM
jgi:hypothetical protein